MLRATRSLLLGTALSCAACTVGPDYEAPDVEVPDSFRFDTEGALGSTDVAWWSAFGDPALEQLVDEALRNNLDVRIAASRVEEFAARVGIARSEAFPQVEYGANAGRSQISREIGAGQLPGVDRTSDFFNANLNVGWELDIWGRIQRATEAARADLLASFEVRRGVILTLVTAVAESYIGLRSLDAQLEIARGRLELRARSLELFELQLSRGVISQLEVAQIRSEYQRTAATIPGFERDIALLENSLSVLLGRAPGPIARGLRLEELTVPTAPAGLPADLLRQRPDLRAAEQDLVAANARIGQAIADFYPRLALTGVLGFASDELSNLTRSSAGLYEVAGQVAGPIFTAGRIEGQVRAAEASEQRALDTYLLSILTALREAEDALIVQSTTLSEIEAQSGQVDALATYSDLANQRYDNGFVSFIEVLDASRDLFDAELEQVRLLANLHLAVVNTYKAFGGGWVTLAQSVTDETLSEAGDPQDPPR